MSNCKGFTTKHLNDDLFSEILKNIDPRATLKSWESIKVDKFGYVTSIVNKEQGRREEERTISETEKEGDKEEKDMTTVENENQLQQLVGMFIYELNYTVPNSKDALKTKIMIKSKARSYEVQDAFSKLIPDSEKELLKLFRNNANLVIGNTDFKELEAVRLNDETMKCVMPKIYWSQMIPDQDVFVFAMEYLEPETVSHMFTVNDICLWKEEDVLCFLDGLSFFHARFYNRTKELSAGLRKYIDVSYEGKVINPLPLFEACISRNLEAGVWTNKQTELGQVILRNISTICGILDSAPKTLVHGDVNLMNECLRRDIKEGMPKLCLFDWEMCGLRSPQHDVISFLATLFPHQEEITKWHYYKEKYYNFLKRKLEMNGTALEFVDFEKVFDMCACIEYVTKYNLCCAIIVPVYKPPAMPRVMSNLEVYVEHVKEKYTFLHKHPKAVL